ncbi:MAG: hypothetical protein HYV60_09155 [Planctomycetia bacterium]|nr:hypothetical protein [Planctomycetia bacterium]
MRWQAKLANAALTVASVCLMAGVPQSIHAQPREPAARLSRPYAPSLVIAGVEFDFNTHRRLAAGSDNWPTTWADDGSLYTAWGDGGGFGGTNSHGRVTLGVARVEGDADTYTGTNVWGGFQPEHAAQFGGKSYGILSFDKTLYMWVVPQPGPHLKECRIASSTDLFGFRSSDFPCRRFTVRLSTVLGLRLGYEH